jgi:hypothetical protein
MTAINKFHNELINWLANNGFSNCDVCFKEDFVYNRIHHRIGIGANEPQNGVSFEQFLYEYGLEYMDIWAPILAFLHEAFHHITLSNFEELELKFYRLLKTDDIMTDFEYWEMPDEFAANIALINFVNNNINAIIELQNIFIDNICAIQENGQTLWDFIEEAI